jgi:hypothetical protein
MQPTSEYQTSPVFNGQFYLKPKSENLTICPVFKWWLMKRNFFILIFIYKTVHANQTIRKPGKLSGVMVISKTKRKLKVFGFGMV